MNSIDWKFIRGFEMAVPFGYMPGNDGKSGVTVATGFDIGQHNEAQIEAMGIPKSLKDKLKPYCGKKGVEAFKSLESPLPPGVSGPPAPPKNVKHSDKEAKKVAYVLQRRDGQGLSLTETEVISLDTAVKSQKSEIFINRFNLDAAQKGKNPFHLLNPKIQTAIASFCFQYGEHTGNSKQDLMDRRRLYWEAVTSWDFEKAVAILSSRFKESNFLARRQAEILLIQAGASIGAYAPGKVK